MSSGRSRSQLARERAAAPSLTRRHVLAGAAGLASLWIGSPALAEPIRVDRALLRFVAPETGGPRAPHFVFERVLAFEARLEALADPRLPADVAYRRPHVQAALERHIAETLLAALNVEPRPTPKEVAAQIGSARLMLLEQVGGRALLERAALAEGVTRKERLALLGRRARASIYLDRMVAPMLAPSTAELKALHRGVANPFRDEPFERIDKALARWYVGRRLRVAINEYYQNVRSRVRVTYLTASPR